MTFVCCSGYGQNRQRFSLCSTMSCCCAQPCHVVVLNHVMLLCSSMSCCCAQPCHVVVLNHVMLLCCFALCNVMLFSGSNAACVVSGSNVACVVSGPLLGHTFLFLYFSSPAHTIQEPGRRKKTVLHCGDQHMCTLASATHDARSAVFVAQSSCTCTDCDRSS